MKKIAAAIFALMVIPLVLEILGDIGKPDRLTCP
jgi:hypothetical protein